MFFKSKGEMGEVLKTCLIANIDRFPFLFHNGTVTRSADFPGVRLPVSLSQPKASAPDSVAMRSTWSGGTCG